jgi:hypothetical protein
VVANLTKKILKQKKKFIIFAQNKTHYATNKQVAKIFKEMGK